MLTIYCDGGSRGNPGHAAFGYVVKDNDNITKEGMGYLGIATNNDAEYSAVINALTWLIKDYKDQDLNFYLDSNLVVSQLNGTFKIKHPAIKGYAIKIKELEKYFSTVTYTYIPREENKQADKLVNIALNKFLNSH